MKSAYPIPAAALDDRLGFLGTAGSGKTYNAGAGVEQLLAAKARVVIVDPLDVWWGLRLAADGKRAGFPLVIFGGAHGDLPLTEASGALIGETVATMGESCIVSLGGLQTKSSERRFMLAFLDAIYRKTDPRKTEPYHLVFDEADLWAPQNSSEPALQSRMEEIVRRGRIKGFIPWLISQRPAVISKDVLSQVDGLVAFKLTSSQDRKAIGEWIKGQADEDQGKAILASLPTLQRGTGVVWIPGRAILTTAAFPPKVTFDSSRTPERGETRQSRDLKPLDLGQLKERLAGLEEEAKASDPKALRAEIQRLQREIAKAPAPAPVETIDSVAIDQAGYERGYRDAAIEWGKALRESAATVATQARALQERLESTAAEIALRLGDAPKPTPRPRAAAPPSPRQVAPAQPRVAAPPVAGLTGPQAHLLTTLRWWAAIGHPTPTRTQLAARAGWTPKGSNLRNRLSELNTAGLVAYPATGRVCLTPAGEAAAPDPDLSVTLLDSIRAVLTGPQRSVFEALLDAGGPMSRLDLAQAIGWEPAGSNLRNRLSELSTLELVDYPERGVVALQDWVTG